MLKQSGSVKIKRVCAWCDDVMGEKEGNGLEPGDVTHGICEECMREMLEEARGFPKDIYGRPSEYYYGNDVCTVSQ